MNDWVRLWHDMPTDPKWRVIARKSGQPLSCVIALFTLLMTTASTAEERGNVTALSIENAAAALDMDEADVEAIFAAMTGRVICDGRLSGWERRQPKRERENDNSSERVKRHRAAAGNGVAPTETPCNAMERQETPREDTDTDTEKKESKRGAFAFDGKVIRLTERDFAQWAKSYPGIDVKAALQSRDDWLADRPEPERKRWFNSTSNWLAKRQDAASAVGRAGAEPAFTSPC